MDTSKAAVKARMENLTDTANALALNDDLDKSPQERLDLFFKFVEVRVWSESLCLIDQSNPFPDHQVGRRYSGRGSITAEGQGGG